MSALPKQAEMERAWRERDGSYDGAFFLAVRSTGVFCRPSCPARKPLARNVSYYASAREALFAGFRPCRRCRPLAVAGTPPGWAALLLSKVDADPLKRLQDQDLRALGIDPARARRHFLKTYGMTFHAYCRARRLGGALQQIRRGASLDEVALGSGFDSHSGFRQAFGRAFGKPPGASRDADCVVVSWIESPIGPLVAGATHEGVCLLEFTDRRMLEAQFATLRRRLRCAIVPGGNGHLEKLASQLTEYFGGKRFRFDVPLVCPGSDFERSVWDALLEIPYGQTRTYRDLARLLGKPGAARAVGHANGCNRVAIVVPCHRVVGAGGTLGGYGGGIWRKRRLLELESSHVEAPAAIG
jgi:AraC family transcriptional regulator of adaptative response/methylated-DNA-[protein]-cysteine methyltransferase